MTMKNRPKSIATLEDRTPANRMTEPEKAGKAKAEPTPLTSDEQRTLLAGERTMLAWIRTALALMGFGFLVAKFGLFLRQLSSVEQLRPIKATGFSIGMGTALVLVGVLVNLYAAVRHRQFAARYRGGSAWFETALAIGLAVIGIITAGYLLIAGL